MKQQLKHNILKKILTLVAVILITALPSYCAITPEIKATAVKFIVAMGAVFLSSFVIFLGLSIYNKLFVEKKYIEFNKEDSLSTPNTTEETITFFIKKNKLR